MPSFWVSDRDYLRSLTVKLFWHKLVAVSFVRAGDLYLRWNLSWVVSLSFFSCPASLCGRHRFSVGTHFVLRTLNGGVLQVWQLYLEKLHLGATVGTPSYKRMTRNLCSVYGVRLPSAQGWSH